jgi:Brp/Blh family beta-carotene 15,15'-monooxygenase
MGARTVDSGERRRLTAESPALWPSRVVLFAVGAGFAVARIAGVTVPIRAQMVVYLVGMVGLNLPHGGYEHARNLWARRAAFQWRYVAAYLAAVAAFLACYVLAPVAGLALAVSVAMAKGGLGGLHVLDATTGTSHLRTRPQRWLAAAVRGGAVMLVPLVAFPETFHAFSSLMVGLVDPGALAPYAWVFDRKRWLLAAGYGTALAVHVGLGSVRGGGRSWLADAGECVLLAGYFATVPVLVAVGLYFPFWYSGRQLARTTAVDDDPELCADPHRATALAAAGAVALFAVLAAVFWAFPNPLSGGDVLPGAVAFWSVGISIVALPHVLVGSVLDRDRGIWYVP